MTRKKRKPRSKSIPGAVTRWLKRSNPGFRKASSVRVRKLKGGGISIQPNVAMGFVDAGGVFHPIRASSDYSKSRAGEAKFRPTERKKPKARKKRK